MTCGLDALLPHFNFIGAIENASEHTKMLLEKVDLWESHGKDYDDGRSLEMRLDPRFSKCNIPPPPTQHDDNDKYGATSIGSAIPLTLPARGFNQRGPSENYKHATSSKESFDKYYTPELLAKVKKAYALDYAIWNDVMSRPSNEIATGSDLSIVQSSCSRRSAVTV